jgi:hypothetical protein
MDFFVVIPGRRRENLTFLAHFSEMTCCREKYSNFQKPYPSVLDFSKIKFSELDF